MVTETLAPPARADRTVTVATVDRRVAIFNRICVGVLIAFALLWLVPILWALDTALKPNAETVNTTWWIDNPTLAAFGRVFTDTDMLQWWASTFIASALSAVLTVATASLAAFALSRMRFKYRTLVFWFILAGIMVPSQVLMVPQFREFQSLGLLNTFWAVALPQAPTAIAVFIFKQFFDGLPADLEEAARVDGAGFFRVYWQIVLPLARPRSPRSRSSRSSGRGTACSGHCWY